MWTTESNFLFPVFFIVTFTLYLGVKIYNHQVILIDILPGEKMG